MINLTLRTEYSFGEAYAPIETVVNTAVGGAIGICDNDGTFGHYKLYKSCKEKNIKPIFGVRLQVIDFREPKKKKWGPVYCFIAKNNDGLTELYELVKLAYDNFYYHPFIEQKDLSRVSENIIVIAESFSNAMRVDYLGLSPFTPKHMLNVSMPRVAINTNRYLTPNDRKVYQLLMGKDRQDSVLPQYVLSETHHYALFHDKKAIENTYAIAEMCNVSFTPAKMVKYKGVSDIRKRCERAARIRNINLDDSVYAARFNREIEIIEQREFSDYFLIVSDMIAYAKNNKMLVGPARGSSAGSLVCYLLGITEIDPIKHGLLFERFIDINRKDLPDIDIDFPDFKRDKVIKYLKGIYGNEYVSHIATISRLKPKSAINIFSQNLCVPFVETEDLKEVLIDRWDGDERANLCIKDTLETTEVGRDYVSRYPKMALAEKIEGHASHTGTHAAGIIVCNDKLTRFGGVNSREDVVMLDMKEAEGLNLLKIDCLGLRTLSVLEEVADRIDMPYSAYYELDIEDENVFKTFNDHRLYGIFQFEGRTLQDITRQMGVKCFNDITAITSLARPGPIIAGGTKMFLDRHTGKEKIDYLSEHPSVIEATEETLGVIVYQEQFMKIAREYAGMSWEDVSALRRAVGKSMGGEFLSKFKDKFIEGAKANGIKESEATHVWINIVGFGSYGFNKSHAVGYGLLSYWTAWAKTYYPYEYACACLNNSRSEESSVKILRDMVKHDGIKYVPIDLDESTDRWEIALDDNGGRRLVGALTSIKGIADKTAKDIVKRRKEGNLTQSQITKMLGAKTAFDVLFPARERWQFLYDDPKRYGLETNISMIDDVRGDGEFVFIGRLSSVHLRDLNEYEAVSKRAGKILESNSLMLNMTLEDDTDSVLCSIDRYRFESLGRVILEHGKVGEDWYLVKGVTTAPWRRVDVKEILNLGDWNFED